ncbi:MAG TPA: DUF4159 domain-containing protein [Candidatus Acidoferrum sp.]|nr:DUF4159 domain-containing protein [Candidatus Acidoferrum sp.]
MRFWHYSCLLLALAVLVLTSTDSYGQYGRRNIPGRTRAPVNGVVPPLPSAEFHWVRLIYGGFGRGEKFANPGTSWTIDWPEAEHFFMQGVQRLTTVDAAQVSLAGDGAERIKLTEDNVYDFPFLYAVEVGHWVLTDQEAAVLRDYLLRGGFFFCDDFHGTQEWEVFMESMRKVFPDRPIVEIPESNELFHTVFELDKSIQIPGLAALYNGVTYEKDGYKPDWRGVFDDKGRLMVVLNHNMDMGDAWENADFPEYPEAMTARAYRFAVNYTVYAMTH